MRTVHCFFSPIVPSVRNKNGRTNLTNEWCVDGVTVSEPQAIMGAEQTKLTSEQKREYLETFKRLC